MSADTALDGGNGKVLFEKGESFFVNILAVHHDPYQWISPKEFRPERFDMKLDNNKWTKTADGKPRNSLAFCPFFGGKRVCIGKTFAEINVKFTIPLLMYYLEIDFADPNMKLHKEQYSLGGS